MSMDGESHRHSRSPRGELVSRLTNTDNASSNVTNEKKTCPDDSPSDTSSNTHKENGGGAWKPSNTACRRTATRAIHSGHRHAAKDKTNTKSERCRTARTLAMRWLSVLMQKPSGDAVLQAYQGQRVEQQRHGHHAHPPPPPQQRQHQDKEFTEKGKGEESAHLAPSVADAARKGAAVLNGSTHHGSNASQGRPLPSPSTFEPVPEEEDSIPRILCSLREIALTGASLGGFSSHEDCAASRDATSSLLDTGCDSADAGTGNIKGKNGRSSPSATERQWEEIRMHFDTVRRLVQNRDELASVLDTALGNGWCLDSEAVPNNLEPLSSVEVTLPPSQSTSSGRARPWTSLYAEEMSTQPKLQKQQEGQQNRQHQERHQQQQPDTGAGRGGSTLNHNAAPFESRLHSVTSSPSVSAAPYYFSGGSAAPVFEAPAKSSPAASPYFPSTPLLAPNNNGGSVAVEPERATTSPAATTEQKSTTPPAMSSSSSSPAVPFKLESREEMLRRRTAAAAAAHYSNTTSSTYYGSRSRTSWSCPVSPLLSFMNPAVGHSQCPFDYLLVLDFEATCEETAPPSYLHEIIEFPVVVVDVKLQRVVAEFHRFVKPKVQPQLSDFCRCLTGIRQEDIDSAAPLDDVIRQFERWYAQTIPPGSRIVFVTDGPNDLREFMYQHSVSRQGIRFPSMFYQWIDVKRLFAHFFQCQQGKIKAMLDVLHCPFEGRLHSGIDDARNIARIVIRMLQVGCSFCEIPLSRLPYAVSTSTPTMTTPSAKLPSNLDGVVPSE
ncbi:hypothetical protein DQ04_00261180 [Trypanosoma grayi]|uniref:hypothetical protein n=1 Tax=Trypanosoma grayi TaxID=71804 RepID=UPI0004F4784E|nr:hypothetical protein DQ04_00261180 [Trypanosoma grayi]KEG14919.1 hypothetical protein DQ04_00261180 [Trypanosoma grayi]